MNQSIIMLLTLIPLCIVAMFIILKNEGDLLEKMRKEKTEYYLNHMRIEK